MRGIRVPMNILLAYGMPYTHLLHGNGPLEDDEIEPFFDGVLDCVSRWTHYLQQQVADTRTEGYLLPVENMMDCLISLSMEDGPEVFALRGVAYHALIDFEHLCSDMARCFTHPPRIKDFYYNLASRTRATFEYLTGEE